MFSDIQGQRVDCLTTESTYKHAVKGHVYEYPTMHYFGIPIHTQSMITYKILTENFWKFLQKVAL